MFLSSSAWTRYLHFRLFLLIIVMTCAFVIFKLLLKAIRRDCHWNWSRHPDKMEKYIVLTWMIYPTFASSNLPFQQVPRGIFFFFFFRFPSSLGALFFFPPPILSWPWNSSTNLNESGICTLELYTKIFAEPARADRVAINLRKINSIMSCYYFTICLLLSLIGNSG